MKINRKKDEEEECNNAIKNYLGLDFNLFENFICTLSPGTLPVVRADTKATRATAMNSANTNMMFYSCWQIRDKLLQK